jgi:hypothetical protein
MRVLLSGHGGEASHVIKTTTKFSKNIVSIIAPIMLKTQSISLGFFCIVEKWPFLGSENFFAENHSRKRMYVIRVRVQYFVQFLCFELRGAGNSMFSTRSVLLCMSSQPYQSTVRLKMYESNKRNS